MQRFIKMIGSRPLAGSREDLIRWYADHVMLLMQYPALIQATLYERRHAFADGACPYVCLYDFPGEDSFEDYSRGEIRSQASAVRKGGWGQAGIEVTRRAEFIRHARRLAPTGQGAAAMASGAYEMHCLSLPDDTERNLRWLGGCIQHCIEQGTISAAAIYRPPSAASRDWLLALELTGPTATQQAAPVFQRIASGADDLAALRPDRMATLWSARYGLLAHWCR